MEYKLKLDDEYLKNVTLEKHINLTYSYDNASLDIYSCIKDVNHNELMVRDLLTDNCKLFIYINSPHCQTCIDKVMSEIQKVERFVTMDNIVFYGKFRNQRDMIAIRNTYPFIRSIYDITNTNFNTPFDTQITPVMFILNSSMHISCMHFVDKNNITEMTIPYFQTIGKRFFDWDEKLYEIDSKKQCSDLNCKHVH